MVIVGNYFIRFILNLVALSGAAKETYDRYSFRGESEAWKMTSRTRARVKSSRTYETENVLDFRENLTTCGRKRDAIPLKATWNVSAKSKLTHRT